MIDNVTTDNMSNEEVIETLKGIVFNGFDRTTRKERQALDLAIKALERPQGEWNYIQAGMCVCPFCGAMPHKEYKNFCANCGAKMEVKKNDHSKT